MKLAQTFKFWLLALMISTGSVSAQTLAPTAQVPPETAPKATELPSISFALKLGFIVYGSGLDKSNCGGSACGLARSGERAYHTQPNLLLSADLFYQPLSVLRTGPSLAYSVPAEVQFDGVPGKTDLGSVLSLDWVLELTPRVGPKTWLLPRLQAGYSMLFPTGDLARRLDTWKGDCRASFGQFKDCSSLDGLRSGVNTGLGLGALFAATEKVRLRIDALAELYWFRILSLSASASDAEITESTYGARYILQGGLEF